MVDFVRSSVQLSVAENVVNTKTAPKNAQKSAGAPAPASSAPVSRGTDVSELAGKARMQEMVDTPPVDIEAVGRIKEAIANGTYPIDLDRVADKLFESYLEENR